MHRPTVSGLLLLFLFLAITASPPPATAVTEFRLEASLSPMIPIRYFSDFFILYLDVDSSGLFNPDVDQVVSFSGLDLTGGGPNAGHYDAISHSPSNSPESPFTDGTPDITGLPAPWWTFTRPDGPDMMVPGMTWTYTQSVVPLPPTALLLGSGLIPLVWWRRRNRLEK